MRKTGGRPPKVWKLQYIRTDELADDDGIPYFAVVCRIVSGRRDIDGRKAQLEFRSKAEILQVLSDLLLKYSGKENRLPDLPKELG